MRFGKTERQKQIERQAMEWAYVLGVKKFLWFPERLSSGEVAWLETVIQQWNVVMVDHRDGEIQVEGYPLCTYTQKEWDEQGQDFHQLFVGSCPSYVKDLVPKYNIAKIPYPGRDNPRVLNNLLDDLSMDDILKDLNRYNENVEKDD